MIMDFEQARENMIEQQIRTWEVLDLGVLDLLSSIPRENFIPEKYRELALADTEIPIGHEQVTLSPKIEARIIQALQIQPEETILEIGTGCGYLTALMARSGQQVTSLELFSDLSESAKKKLNNNEISNVEVICEDGLQNPPAASQYDVIVLGGSLPYMIDAFSHALKPGGRLFTVIGESYVMEAQLITKIQEDNISTESLFETQIPTLIGAPRNQQFKL